MLAQAISVRSGRSRARPLAALRWQAGLMLVLCLGLLAGCLLPADSRSGDSDLPLEAWFPDNPGAQELALAAELGRLKDIRRLMQDEKVDPDTVFSVPDGLPLLAIPILAKQPESLRTMLELGADPNVKQAYDTGDRGMRYHGNAMVWAAKQEDPVYLKLLLDHGGDPDTRNANNETLLLQAKLQGDQWQNIKLLVERGADINARSQGTTILLDYVSLGGFERAYWLLEHGADPALNFMKHPDKPNQSHIVDAIFWHPVSKGYDPVWQRKCQQWLLARGYKRPPMPEHYRQMRKNLGFETREDKIPLL